MYYFWFWSRWFPYCNHEVIHSFEDCIRPIPIRLQLGRKSFTPNQVPHPHIFALQESMHHRFDVLPRLNSFYRYVDSLPSQIVDVFKTWLEISKVLLWRWRRIRRTTEEKITRKTKFATKQHLWWSIASSLMDSTAVCKQEQRKLQIPVLLISGYQKWEVI